MPADPRIKDVGSIETEHLFDIVVDLKPRLDFGPGPIGNRVFFESAGGTFEGTRLRGEVLPGGGDWTIFRADGSMTLDVRLTLRTDDGALILMTYGGRWITTAEQRAALAVPEEREALDPASYYFRTNPLFETGSPDYAWLNDIVCVGKGYLVENAIAYKVFALA